MIPEVTPAAVLPSPVKDNPGGTPLTIVHEEVAAGAPLIVKTTVPKGTPTVPLAGLSVEALSVVAPAMLCTAPRAPSVVAAAFRTLPAVELRT